MSSGHARRQRCTSTDARARLSHARKFLEVAELVASEDVAETLVTQIEPGGRAAAETLRRLLDLKDAAHYGLIRISRQKLTAALRQAQALVDFAAKTR